MRKKQTHAYVVYRPLDDLEGHPNIQILAVVLDEVLAKRMILRIRKFVEEIRKKLKKPSRKASFESHMRMEMENQKFLDSVDWLYGINCRYAILYDKKGRTYTDPYYINYKAIELTTNEQLQTP